MDTSYIYRQYHMRIATRLGFNEARARAEASIARGWHEDDVFIPLTETCWWAVSLDECLSALWPESSRPGEYRSVRDAHPEGRVMSALRIARNALGHQRFFTAKLIGGIDILRDRRDPRETIVRWTTADELEPFLDPTMKQIKRAEVLGIYRTELQGRNVLDTFDAVTVWFDYANI